MSNSAKVVKKRRHRWIKALIIILILVICTVSLISYFKGNILPVVLTMSEATVKSMAVNAINSASHIIIDESVQYSDMVTITKSADDKIQMVQANTVKINRLARDLANVCQDYIEKIGNQTIELPVGAFTGSVVMSGLGPNVSIPLMPIGSVICDFVSLFEEVGINQTRHSIYININTTISLVLPVSSVPVNVCTTILVCDNIIVGKVPDVYFNSTSNKGVLDLLPVS